MHKTKLISFNKFLLIVIVVLCYEMLPLIGEYECVLFVDLKKVIFPMWI